MPPVNRTNPAGEGWIAFPYNGSSDFADIAATQALEYRMNVLGAVEFRGRCAKATGGAANDVIGTLPTDYRPPASLRFSVPHDTGQMVIAVPASGAVTTVTGATANKIIDLTTVDFYPLPA